ncbi:MAG: hypothetical protein WCJ58_08565 [bacterium]
MKKKYIGLLLFLAIGLSSCDTSRYIVNTFSPDYGYASACPDPIYIATVSKTAGTHDQKSLTLATLLNDAKVKYGNDVTIQNVRWDLLTDKVTKVSVVYDVIKCK